MSKRNQPKSGGHQTKSFVFLEITAKLAKWTDIYAKLLQTC